MNPAETPTFLAHLGDDIAARPRPTMRGALAAVGGTLFALGLLVMAGEKLGEGSKGLPIAVALIAVAAGYGALFGLAGKVDRHRIEPAAVAAISIGATVTGFLIAFDFDDPKVTAPVLLATVALALVWVVPGTRGRPLPLGLALAGVWFLLLDATSDSFSPDVSGGSNVAEDGSLISLIYGVALLFGAYFLDKNERHGVLATPLVAVGNLAYIVGTFGVIGSVFDDDSTGTSLLVIAAGLALAFVGNAGVDRRFTTWTGATGVLFGVSSFVENIFDGSSSPTAPGLALTVVGLGIAGAAIAWEAISNLGGGAGDGPHTPATQGWYPDPTGRHEQRYFDGSTWTSHVTAGGETQTDPYGAT